MKFFIESIKNYLQKIKVDNKELAKKGIEKEQSLKEIEADIKKIKQPNKNA